MLISAAEADVMMMFYFFSSNFLRRPPTYPAYRNGGLLPSAGSVARGEHGGHQKGVSKTYIQIQCSALGARLGKYLV